MRIAAQKYQFYAISIIRKRLKFSERHSFSLEGKYTFLVEIF